MRGSLGSGQGRRGFVDGGYAIDRRPRRRIVALLSGHNEEANLEALVEEALEALPALADKFEIIAVDDGSRDRTAAIADELALKHPDVFRVVHHPTNLVTEPPSAPVSTLPDSN